MEFLAISDSHSKHKHIPKDWLLPADCIIHAGDISTRGHEHEVIAFLDWFSSLDQYKYKVFIAGNHDWFFQDYPSKVKELLAKYPNIIYLEDSGVTIEGIKIWGSPIQPEFFQWAFNRQRGPVIRKHWDIIPSDSDIIVTHGPVFRQLDLVINDYSPNSGEHVGCADLKDVIEKIKPKVHICGHIHCGYGQSENEHGTKFINAAVVNESYEVANEPIKFTI